MKSPFDKGFRSVKKSASKLETFDDDFDSKNLAVHTNKRHAE